MMILKHENLDNLLAKYPIRDFNDENTAHLNQLHEQSVADIKNNMGKLSSLPPLEKHPYLKKLDASADITGLMIGTFPPITYLADDFNLLKLEYGKQRRLERPEIPFFHGNRSSFWKFSPFNFNKILSHQNRDEKPSMISQSLASKNVAYTDIIKYCQRSFPLDKKKIVDKYPADDACLNNIHLNTDVYDFLFTNNKVNRLYFTNSYAFGMGKDFFTGKGTYYLKKRDAFQLFLKGASDMRIMIEVSLPNLNFQWININERQRVVNERKDVNSFMRTKAYLKMRLTKDGIVKVFDVVSSVSPSAIGGTRTTSESNRCVIKYAEGNKVNIKESCEGLIRQSLKAFFDNDVKSLAQYND